MDSVAVVIEGRFVEQRRANHVSRVHDRAVGGVTENVGNRRNVVTAPLRGSIGLRDLLRNPVTKN